MRFKRDEGFRFSFGTPILAFFTIEELNGKKIGTSEGEARVLDLSPNGMKFASQLDIPKSNQNDVKITVRFTLHESEHHIQGQIIWKQKAVDGFFYGMQFSINEEDKEIMIKDLKHFAKWQYNKNSPSSSNK